MNIMNHKGFKAQIMKAQRLIGSGVHGLPSGSPIDIYPVDTFEDPLSNWIKGAGNYVVPVDADWGLWFNWSMNEQENTSVLLSVKGMNPVTGQRTNGFALEKYEEKCPIHDVKFSDGLFCEKCNYKWPYQNYIAYPNILWWDGFRSSDGKVRQFFFTEDLAKSIPELVIGKEDTIPAFGFAFFKPKVLRQVEQKISRLGCFVSSGVYASDVYYTTTKFATAPSEDFCSGNAQCVSGPSGMSGPMGTLISDSSKGCMGVSGSTGYKESQKVRSRKKVEVGVGAGAEISQDLKCDLLKVSDWENEPASIMRLYFVFVEQFEEIKAKGIKDLVGEKEGYLSNLPVG